MPGNQRRRRIASPPRFSGYKPYGCQRQHEQPVALLFEEYEAIKMADYKFMNHQEAALLMGISRATFARIYESARRKIALALVESREIITESGNSYTDKQWYHCPQCNCRFTLPAKLLQRKCPVCQSEEFEKLPFQTNQQSSTQSNENSNHSK